MIAPARQAALRVLQQVARGATLADALARERDRLADARDRGLVTEIATGTLRWLARLDAQLGALSSRPWSDVDPAVRDVLRLAAYQLLFLDRIPARAIVDDAVEQTREAVGPKATGFVNGLLRTLARTHPQGSWSVPSDNSLRTKADGAESAETDDSDLDALAATLSHPRWLLARWRARYGGDAMRRWARFDNEAPDLTLRANRLRGTREALIAALTDEGVVVEPTRFAAEGLRVVEGQPIGGPAARRGLFTVQDEASQLVGELAAALAGGRMLDTCAAPGGKTLALAAAAARTPSSSREGAMVVAADRRPRRLRVLRDTLAHAGAAEFTRVIQIDLRRGLPFRAAFDLVLVDAPCSGLGTVRREPDIKWRRTEAELAEFAGTQARMLDVASRVVAPGGRLVYATCSSEPDENEAVVAAFLDRTPRFEAEAPDRARLPAGVAAVIDDKGHLRTWPHLHGLEAFFAAVVRRPA